MVEFHWVVELGVKVVTRLLFKLISTGLLPPVAGLPHALNFRVISPAVKYTCCDIELLNWITTHWLPFGYGIGNAQAPELFAMQPLLKVHPGTIVVEVIL